MSDAPASRKAVIVVSRYNEAVSRKLLDGARDALRDGGFSDGDVDVFWVPGAFELPVVVGATLETSRYDLAVALGVVIRGETPHFEYVAGEAARGLTDVALESGTAVGFGVLTCDTIEQALERAGGSAGNKGAEAAEAAMETARVLRAVWSEDAAR